MFMPHVDVVRREQFYEKGRKREWIFFFSLTCCLMLSFHIFHFIYMICLSFSCFCCCCHCPSVQIFFSSFSLTLELDATLVKVRTCTKPKIGWYCGHCVCSLMMARNSYAVQLSIFTSFHFKSYQCWRKITFWYTVISPIVDSSMSYIVLCKWLSQVQYRPFG